MTKANNGARKRTYYGVPLGILMLDTQFERFNGDIGNAQTWPFPVQYKIVRGALDTQAVKNRKQARSRYGAKADKK